MAHAWCWRRAKGARHDLPKLSPKRGNCHEVARIFVPAVGKWQEIGKWVWEVKYMIYLYKSSSFANLPDLPQLPIFRLHRGNAYSWQIWKSAFEGVRDD
jgi:hypothetical protein